MSDRGVHSRFVHIKSTKSSARNPPFEIGPVRSNSSSTKSRSSTKSKERSSSTTSKTSDSTKTARERKQETVNKKFENYLEEKSKKEPTISLSNRPKWGQNPKKTIQREDRTASARRTTSNSVTTTRNTTAASTRNSSVKPTPVSNIRNIPTLSTSSEDESSMPSFNVSVSSRSDAFSAIKYTPKTTTKQYNEALDSTEESELHHEIKNPFIIPGITTKKKSPVKNISSVIEASSSISFPQPYESSINKSVEKADRQMEINKKLLNDFDNSDSDSNEFLKFLNKKQTKSPKQDEIQDTEIIPKQKKPLKLKISEPSYYFASDALTDEIEKLTKLVNDLQRIIEDQKNKKNDEILFKQINVSPKKSSPATKHYTAPILDSGSSEEEEDSNEEPIIPLKTSTASKSPQKKVSPVKSPVKPSSPQKKSSSASEKNKSGKNSPEKKQSPNKSQEIAKPTYTNPKSPSIKHPSDIYMDDSEISSSEEEETPQPKKPIQTTPTKKDTSKDLLESIKEHLQRNSFSPLSVKKNEEEEETDENESKKDKQADYDSSDDVSDPREHFTHKQLSLSPEKPKNFSSEEDSTAEESDDEFFVEEKAPDVKITRSPPRSPPQKPASQKSSPQRKPIPSKILDSDDSDEEEDKSDMEEVPQPIISPKSTSPLSKRDQNRPDELMLKPKSPERTKPKDDVDDESDEEFYNNIKKTLLNKQQNNKKDADSDGSEEEESSQDFHEEVPTPVLSPQVLQTNPFSAKAPQTKRKSIFDFEESEDSEEEQKDSNESSEESKIEEQIPVPLPRQSPKKQQINDEDDDTPRMLSPKRGVFGTSSSDDIVLPEIKQVPLSLLHSKDSDSSDNDEEVKKPKISSPSRSFNTSQKVTSQKSISANYRDSDDSEEEIEEEKPKVTSNSFKTSPKVTSNYYNSIEEVKPKISSNSFKASPKVTSNYYDSIEEEKPKISSNSFKASPKVTSNYYDSIEEEKPKVSSNSFKASPKVTSNYYDSIEEEKPKVITSPKISSKISATQNIYEEEEEDSENDEEVNRIISTKLNSARPKQKIEEEKSDDQDYKKTVSLKPISSPKVGLDSEEENPKPSKQKFPDYKAELMKILEEEDTEEDTEEEEQNYKPYKETPRPPPRPVKNFIIDSDESEENEQQQTNQSPQRFQIRTEQSSDSNEAVEYSEPPMKVSAVIKHSPRKESAPMPQHKKQLQFTSSEIPKPSGQMSPMRQNKPVLNDSDDEDDIDKTKKKLLDLNLGLDSDDSKIEEEEEEEKSDVIQKVTYTSKRNPNSSIPRNYGDEDNELQPIKKQVNHNTNDEEESSDDDIEQYLVTPANQTYSMKHAVQNIPEDSDSEEEEEEEVIEEIKPNISINIHQKPPPEQDDDDDDIDSDPMPTKKSPPKLTPKSENEEDDDYENQSTSKKLNQDFIEKLKKFGIQYNLSEDSEDDL